MIHFDLPKAKSSIIKVLGVGGGGSNAVNFMFEQDIEGVDFIICNTDAKAIEQSKIPNKIQLGPYLTQGLGAGANPEVGKKATEESLDEIKRILEVNTKMAFITAGMGGGTGTGGAPIIAQICKDLGILTVGIVTTPFSFEGPRRMAQAEEGIRQLKPLVDTLLVISNDKLRMQYGNLKMREAFGKADNVLGTAAKCITDIINSRGHIIVDFADVCTVMKNGGVAILGSAAVEGEDRAQRAIEEAINSPLLNDSDISGAKWILVNINSQEGDHECSMDELEIISNYLRMQAGAGADVIMGMGHDDSLGEKLGITVIATGFEHKDPFDQQREAAKPKPAEKIVMTLDLSTKDEKKSVVEATQQTLPLVEVDPYLPTMQNEVIEEEISSQPFFTENMVASYSDMSLSIEEEQAIEDAKEVLRFELSTDLSAEVIVPTPDAEEVMPPAVPEYLNFSLSEKPATVTATPLLSKPSNIYAIQEETDVQHNVVEEPAVTQTVIEKQPPTAPAQQNKPVDVNYYNEEAEELELQLVEKEIASPVAPQTQMAIGDDLSTEEEQKRRAQDRIQKLRNLSFNVNGTDAGGEFDAVPAYVRRNMELFGNTLTSVENFYSKYTVNKDENDKTNISTINTFLDGKKPD